MVVHVNDQLTLEHVFLAVIVIFFFFVTPKV